MTDRNRGWIANAIEVMRAEQQRSADTHLLRLPFPEFPHIDIYLKDETSHPTGSLKHRLARSLYLHGLANGDIDEHTHIVEASSGSTAIAEAYFARLLGLRLTAVIPATTSPTKIGAIRAAGANVQCASAGEDLCAVAARIAETPGTHFMDQFTFAERATDWRGNNNIAESIFAQLRHEPNPAPAWIVMGAGTGGTSATLGRYIRYRPELASVRLCVVDPAGSALLPAYAGNRSGPGTSSDVIEGIGRRHVPASFVPRVIDRMISVSDAAAIAATHWLARRTGRRFGPSTGANLIGILSLAAEMAASGREGSLVTLGCDGGDRYAETIFDDAWLGGAGIDLGAWRAAFDLFDRLGIFSIPPIVPEPADISLEAAQETRPE